MDTFQIFTRFSAQLLHSVAQNCDYATFIADCFYVILQKLLRICMSIKASVKFQSIHHTTFVKLFKKYYDC